MCSRECTIDNKIEDHRAFLSRILLLLPGLNTLKLIFMCDQKTQNGFERDITCTTELLSVVRLDRYGRQTTCEH